MIDPMIKFSLLAHRGSQGSVLEVLESLGAVELMVSGESSGEPDPAHQSAAERVKNALLTVQRYNPSNKGLLASFLPDKIPLSKGEFSRMATFDEQLISGIEGVGREYEAVTQEIHKHHQRLRDLTNWLGLKFAWIAPNALAPWSLILGSWPAGQNADITNLAKKTPRGAELIIGSEDEREVFGAIVLHGSEREAFLKMAGEYDFELEDLTWGDSPRQEVDKINLELTQLRIKHHELHGRLVDFGRSERRLKVLLDHLTSRAAVAQELTKLTNTQSTFGLKGWAPKRLFGVLSERITKVTHALELKQESPLEGEVPPVILRNNGLIRPFESVTRIYGLPRSDEPDPTPWLAPFFAIFFGLALTDAGYGLVLLILIPILKKVLKISGEAPLMKVLFMGGLTTTVMGALFGTWFGIVAPDLPEFLGPVKTFLTPLLLIDPSKEPVNFLLLMFALGFIHLLVGLLVKLWWRCKNGQWLDALLDQGAWLLALLAIATWILSLAGLGLPSGVAVNLVYAGVLALLLTQGRAAKNIFTKGLGGLLSLYGFIGYLSDILSYSRLLALGLATGIVGLVVNLIASIFRDMIPVPGLNWLVFALVFIGGHTFNIAINALGGFIHSSRLQFVEFFPKFMEGGGRALRPLRPKYQYVEITDE